MPSVPTLRVRALNAAPVAGGGEFVLYWMVASRRSRSSFALQRAADWARRLGRPLLVLEALRVAYPFASERLHRFVIDGMVENARAFAGRAAYFPYLERTPGEGKGLLEALARRACLVISDDFPAFFLPRMQAAVAPRLPVLLEVVDGCGLVPLRAPGRLFTTARSFRAYLQKHLLGHLAERPAERPLRRLPPPGKLPVSVTRRWRPAATDELDDPGALLASLPIDHRIAPVAVRGGSAAAALTLRRFVGERLGAYVEDGRHPDADATSGLSPYLHFGQVSAHQIVDAIISEEGWEAERLAGRGGRRGFWGMTPGAEAFLDQLVTWRELGFNFCALREGHAGLDSLPEWARRTLLAHAADPRPWVYSIDELAAARTHDPIWNAAQRQLLVEGRIHNSLRMLWGKKILEWSGSPAEALRAMLQLNDSYALDGRDPSSVSGICWVLGRYDRPWGPERPIFGTVRYMSSQSARRKLRLREYLIRFGSINEPSAPAPSAPRGRSRARG